MMGRQSVTRRAGLIVVLAAWMAGCEQVGLREPRPGAESILEVLAPPTPEEARILFEDMTNADNRYRGAVLLTNAWFAGENDVYLRSFARYLEHDRDPSIRAVCARGLGNHAGPEYALVLAGAMRQDGDVEVRAEAARALQRIHNPDVILSLIEASREPDPRKPNSASEPEVQVRVEAAYALGQYANPSVVDALMVALDDSSLVVQRALLDSLTTLTGQDFGHDVAAWSRWRGAHSSDLFAARGVYEYPVFSRSRLWWEYIPLVPGPPNETPSTPSGMTLGDG
jgi:hypothetical protein